MNVDTNYDCPLRVLAIAQPTPGNSPVADITMQIGLGRSALPRRSAEQQGWECLRPYILVAKQDYSIPLCNHTISFNVRAVSELVAVTLVSVGAAL